MKFTPGARFASTAVALTVTSALLVSGCSSSKKSAASSSAGGSTATTSATGDATGSPAGAATTGSCPSGTLKGEGSTAQTNAMTSWVNGFQKQCSGATVNYNPTGSGPGVSQFIGKQVNFAGSDAALDPVAGEPAKAKAACGSTALDLPMVVGPVAVAVKVKGISDGGITLTPKVTTQIFLGKITKWNDPAIAALNKGVSLPSENITVFFRSDQSGTTSNFEKYLAANDPTDFTAKPSKTWAGKVGQGKAKSQGVQQAITATEGSIGYIEYAFALSGNLATAKIDNGGGAVALSPGTASAAAAAAKVTGVGNDLTLKLDYATKAAGAYPIVLVTYEVVCSKYADPKIGTFVKDFLTYTSTTGQTGLANLGYAPIPASIKTKLTAAIASIS